MTVVELAKDLMPWNHKLCRNFKDKSVLPYFGTILTIELSKKTLSEGCGVYSELMPL